jgi:uncharacterized membrane protein
MILHAAHANVVSKQWGNYIRNNRQAAAEVVMGWNRWYAARSYLRSALWIVPLIALLLEQVAIRVTAAVDLRLNFPQLAATPAGTIGVMDTIVTLTISFVVFTFGSMLVAIQVASGQLTPRIIATALLRDNVIRFTVGLFVFTLLFAAGTRAHIGTDVPHFAVTVAVTLGIASTMAFLYLIDYTARLLRPVTIVWRIGEQGIKVIESVYPNPIREPEAQTKADRRQDHQPRILNHQGKSAIILAVNLEALVALARRTDGVVELVPRVGDFVAAGEPMFRLYRGAVKIDDRMLRQQVAMGPERTIEQDSTLHSA